MKSIAIIGASSNREKFGNKAVRAYVEMGWTVYPINPKETVIEDLKCYPNLRAIPGPIDEVSLYIPPALVPPVLRDIAALNIPKVWLNPGTDSDDALNLAEDLGLEAVQGCSIVAIGINPDQL